MTLEIEANEFKKYYNSSKKYNEYVIKVEKAILSKVLSGEIEDFSEEINDRFVLSNLVSTFNEYIHYFVTNMPSNSNRLRDYVQLNKLFISTIVKVKKLCEEFDVDLMKLTTLLMSDPNIRELNRNIQKAFESNKHEGLELFIDAVTSGSKTLLPKLDMDKMMNLYDHPKKLALALNAFFLNEINNAICLEANADGIFYLNDGRVGVSMYEGAVKLELLKPTGFKLKYNEVNSYDYFSKLYHKLIKEPISFVDRENTSAVSFIEVLLSKNIIETLDRIYFSVDRYQACYILVHKLGNYYKGDFEKVIVDSEMFYKKPFGGSKPLPLTQRDINDYRKKYNGHKARIGNDSIKNYGLIDAIFADLR